MSVHFAPGWPGIAPRWNSSAKSGVGTALNDTGHVWFTLSHGIFNEIYYPRVDLACIRDMGLIVIDSHGSFSEEKRHTQSALSYVAPGVPAYRLVNTCTQQRFQIEKTIIADPFRDVVLQRTRFRPLVGDVDDYRLYALLAPHLGNRGAGNTAWIGAYKGVPMLFAARDGIALALASSVPWLARSAGFVGVSDGWQDLIRHKRLAWAYDRAENGNVALTGQIALPADGSEFDLALGFGRNSNEAGHRALASLLAGFQPSLDRYVQEWGAWQRGLLPLDETSPRQRDLYRISMAVLASHESVHFHGGIIASLSIPWGFAKGDEDLGGYHLVWPRDLVESGGALLAAGAPDEARRVLWYLRSTQEADGHWPQNMWLDGAAYWSGVQMDETAFPILLVDLARRHGVLSDDECQEYWPMVRRAAGYLVRNGPVTQQDRWEEDPGYSPFTLAVEIAALLVAAEIATLAGDANAAAYACETADFWNANVERWTYVRGTDLAQRVGVDGYYVRIAPPDTAEAASPLTGYVPVKNRPPGQMYASIAQLVSPDALALVRFGLRAADDPRIVNTVRVVDALLKVELPAGPAWHRYNGDGYGEHDDGRPFDGTGVGRLWPLLAGERGHYELAAGRPEEAERLLGVIEAAASPGGMLPEQVWDGPDLPERRLFFGEPSGSAMPLAWAHAEYVKLRRSLRDGRVFDLPAQTYQRYVVQQHGSPFVGWRFNQKIDTMPAGATLRIETMAPAVVHWSADGWRTTADLPTRPTGLEMHLVDLPTAHLEPAGRIVFTFYWPHDGHWEGSDFEVVVEARTAEGAPVESGVTPAQAMAGAPAPAPTRHPTTRGRHAPCSTRGRGE